MTREISTAELNHHLLKTTTTAEWNAAISDSRFEMGSYWGPDLSGRYLADMQLNGRDFMNADLTGASLSYAEMEGCNLRGVDFLGCTVTNVSLVGSDLTNAYGLDTAQGIMTAKLDDVIGYRRPLPDRTFHVASMALAEAVRDKTSILNEGLDDLRSNCVNMDWVGTSLRFWLSHEIEEISSPCTTGDCYCEVEHACHGTCECCPCYLGECDCEPNHENDTDETGNVYLATVIGSVEFEWNDNTGYRGVIKMNEATLHPHVATSGAPCWGDAVMPRTLRTADYILMILGWVGQHNPESEYREIRDLPRLY